MGSVDDICKVSDSKKLDINIVYTHVSLTWGLSRCISFMGPAEVAAWGIVGFLWDTFENLTGEYDLACRFRD